MPIEIHGKMYVTVAERLAEAKEELLGVNTEVLFSNPVVIKATIHTTKGTFTGISAANASKQIEKESPYEVAETSAVGRALAFAGYLTTTGIASAEEMRKVYKSTTTANVRPPVASKSSQNYFCEYHKVAMKLNKNGKPYHMDSNRPEGDKFCNGTGFPTEHQAWKEKYQFEAKEAESGFPDSLGN